MGVGVKSLEISMIAKNQLGRGSKVNAQQLLLGKGSKVNAKQLLFNYRNYIIKLAYYTGLSYLETKFHGFQVPYFGL